MAHAAALDRLMALGGELVTRRKFDLAHMRALLASLGNPQQRFPSVLIAGTNGKGSTAATLASILSAAGYTTGLYTSPHLSRVNERIRILPPARQPRSSSETNAPALEEIGSSYGDGTARDLTAATAEIDDATLFSCLALVEEATRSLVAAETLPGPPSFFETMTAIAMLAFARLPSRVPVDIAVLEVGMGGRLDATNVVEPLLSVITDISLDHTEWLGPTLSAIAREKAGILRPRGLMVTLPQHPEVNQALGEVAVSLNARGVNAADYLPGRDAPSSPRNRYTLTAAGERLAVDSPLAGQHQQRNLALAIAAAMELRNQNGYALPNAAIAAGIHTTHWPGRLERFTSPIGSAVLLDVAHNPAGAWALRAAISHIDTPGPRHLLFGCMRDKALDEIAQILFPVFDRVWLVVLPSPRAASLADLLAAAVRTGTPATAAQSVASAVSLALESPQADQALLVASGSVVLVGAVRELLV